MDTSPSSYSRDECEELQVAFEVLYEESLNMAKKNIKLKNSLHNVNFENEALK